VRCSRTSARDFKNKSLQFLPHSVYSLNYWGVHPVASVSSNVNKPPYATLFGARFYCALTLHVSAPIGGHLQVLCDKIYSKVATVFCLSVGHVLHLHNVIADTMNNHWRTTDVGWSLSSEVGREGQLYSEKINHVLKM
jgi:hypothetical protein